LLFKLWFVLILYRSNLFDKFYKNILPF